MHPTNPRLARIQARRAALIKRADEVATDQPAHVAEVIMHALGDVQSSALLDGTSISREWRAIQNRDEVARLSIAGMPVAQIATTLGLSTSHVVRLRARLGVGRRR